MSSTDGSPGGGCGESMMCRRTAECVCVWGGGEGEEEEEEEEEEE